MFDTSHLAVQAIKVVTMLVDRIEIREHSLSDVGQILIGQLNWVDRREGTCLAPQTIDIQWRSDNASDGRSQTRSGCSSLAVEVLVPYPYTRITILLSYGRAWGRIE